MAILALNAAEILGLLLIIVILMSLVVLDATDVTVIEEGEGSE